MRVLLLWVWEGVRVLFYGQFVWGGPDDRQRYTNRGQSRYFRILPHAE
jgi:hypothetical protein